MIEQSIVHLPDLIKDIDRPVSIYLMHLSSSADITTRTRREPLGQSLGQYALVSLQLKQASVDARSLITRLDRWPARSANFA